MGGLAVGLAVGMVMWPAARSGQSAGPLAVLWVVLLSGLVPQPRVSTGFSARVLKKTMKEQDMSYGIFLIFPLLLYDTACYRELNENSRHNLAVQLLEM